MLLGLGKTLTFGQQKIYPYATGGDYVYLYEDTATGKTYRVHEFLTTGTSTLNVEIGGQVEVLIVAGGGSGGQNSTNLWGRPGGGGAGGVLEIKKTILPGTISIEVGNGGVGVSSENRGNNGENSSFGEHEATGGGGGSCASSRTGRSGGSGGGGMDHATSPGSGGSGISGQGNRGGDGRVVGSAAVYAGGGGGASTAGGDPPNGVGGNGIQWLNGKFYGGGGGAAATNPQSFAGGSGGGGTGRYSNGSSGTPGTGGGGGGSVTGTSGAGGSGIVIVRYVIAEKKLWTPAELENLSFWFDVSQETPQSDDTEMTSLTDFSGNGRNLTAYGTTKPKYRTNLLNGLPGVKFTGSGLFWTQNWQSGDWPLLYDPLTLATISREANNSQTFAFEMPGGSTISRFGVFGTFYQYWNAWATYRYAFALAGGVTPVQSYTNTPSLGSDSIKVSTKNSSGTTTMRGNGSDCTPGLYYANANGGGTVSDLHVNVSSTTRYRGMSIGGTINNPITPTFYFTPDNTYFYEVVHYNEVLSSENQKKLEGYLAHKWGKTSSLPSGHPYKYEPPYKVEPEEIVTDGLVLNLDAGDYASYPRSGTTWYDISGNGLTGALTNGPTYDSANKGSIVFDGSNDHTLLPTNFFSYPSLTTFTISLWFRSSQTSGGTLFGQQNSNNPSSAGGWVPVVYLRSDGKIRVEPFWTGGSSSFILSSSTLNDDNWHNIVTTFNSGTNQLYVDGVYVTQQTGRTLTSYTSTYYYIIGAGYAASRGLGTNYFSGNIANFSFYNRALSSTEIQQNFNALRGRYGV